ncbi:MAG: YheC/YheD family protein [Bacillota bacterium]|uniref:YheC/YheD family endospore coat-associated protein n=1 Tax=Rossellomorea sp. FM04394 TaxID=3243076 RepID=UPI0035A6A7FA
MKKYIGIMVGTVVFNGIKKGKTYYENLSFYEEAGEHYNLIPCYFRFQDIEPGVDTIMAYVLSEEGTYILTPIPKPPIIHNRTFTGKVSAKKKMRKLKEEGIVFFNEKNRYKKIRINNILRRNKKLVPHIPETVKASKENLQMMMDKYDELIIKPNSGSLGIGIAKLSRLSDQEWEFSYRRQKEMVKERFSITWPFFLLKLIANPRTIIQKRIPLAKSKGGVFDLRVSVQKNDSGEWQMTGVVGKVAKKDWYLTNVARGGSCYSLPELLQDLPHLKEDQVFEDIKRLSLNVALQLEKELPKMADLGLDIGLTNEGFPMFIECNGRDLRVTFRNADMQEEWKKTHATPIGYASFLYEKRGSS